MMLYHLTGRREKKGERVRKGKLPRAPQRLGSPAVAKKFKVGLDQNAPLFF